MARRLLLWAAAKAFAAAVLPGAPNVQTEPTFALALFAIETPNATSQIELVTNWTR